MNWFRTRYTIDEIDQIRTLIVEIDELKHIHKWGYESYPFGDNGYGERVERRLRTYLEAGIPLSDFEAEKRDYLDKTAAKRLEIEATKNVRVRK